MSRKKRKKHIIIFIITLIISLMSLVLKSTYAEEGTAPLIVYTYIEGTKKTIGGYQRKEYAIGDKYTTTAHQNEDYELVYSSGNTEGIMTEGGQTVYYYYKRKVFSVYDYCDFNNLSEEVRTYIENNITKIENGEIDITYELFGALGDGVTDDSYAIKATHDFVNAENMFNNKNFIVKGTPGKTYYIGKDTDSISIVSNVDWQGANFIIDDGIINPTNEDESSKLQNHLFRVFSKMRYKVTTHNLTLAESTIDNLKLKIKRGDKKLEVLADYINNLDISTTDYYIGSTSGQLAGIKKEFAEVSKYYIIVYDNETRYYIRGGTTTYPPTSTMGDPKKDQFIIDKEGNILTDISLDFDNIDKIEIFPIYDEELTIKNGHFLTRTNNQVYNPDSSKNSYIERNIYVLVNNVTFDNITHDLDEETHRYVDTNYQRDQNGNLYTGFIATSKCANLTITNSRFSSHSFTVGTYLKNSYNGTYDLSLNMTLNVNFNNVSYVVKENQTEEEAYYENMLNTTTRWSTVGMNYVKNLNITNSKLNTVSSHKGTYNVSIKDSIIGKRGVILAGGDDFNITDVTIDSAPSLISFHEDYGSIWKGTIRFNNIKYKLPTRTYSVYLLSSNLIEDKYYGFQSYFPNVEINNLEIDDSGLTNPKSKVYLIGYNESVEYDINSPYKYYFPKTVMLNNVTINNRSLTIFSNYFINKSYLTKERYSNTSEDDTEIILDNVKLNPEENIKNYNIKGGQFIITEEILDLNNLLLDEENNIIYPIKNKTTGKALIDNNIITTGTPSILDKQDNQILKTGDILRIKKNNKNNDFTLSITGDIAPDSKANIGDVAKLYRYLINELEIDKASLIASDINADNLVNDSDLNKLYSYIKGNIDSLE